MFSAEKDKILEEYTLVKGPLGVSGFLAGAGIHRLKKSPSGLEGLLGEMSRLRGLQDKVVLQRPTLDEYHVLFCQAK